MLLGRTKKMNESKEIFYLSSFDDKGRKDAKKRELAIDTIIREFGGLIKDKRVKDDEIFDGYDTIYWKVKATKTDWDKMVDVLHCLCKSSINEREQKDWDKAK